ncbi:hypothetical protein QFW96_01030 [Saccharopolyspora sp. TS4A08]|uniref:Uncharacterized protein n=1 Tax=Saccharopolyspora ipomoeae TaxID=3042027 RepID=A0ABT6PGP7_9PSEU|nr:hypothetical protein [Saccharopolyspora sp. TS4A08]MDI2027166.1 hypothetical protein [Saccharopolyspora sp. TS4A08]
MSRTCPGTRPSTRSIAPRKPDRDQILSPDPDYGRNQVPDYRRNQVPDYRRNPTFGLGSGPGEQQSCVVLGTAIQPSSGGRGIAVSRTTLAFEIVGP